MTACPYFCLHEGGVCPTRVCAAVHTPIFQGLECAVKIQGSPMYRLPSVHWDWYVCLMYVIVNCVSYVLANSLIGAWQKHITTTAKWTPSSDSAKTYPKILSVISKLMEAIGRA